MSGFILKVLILYAAPIPLTTMQATSPSIDSHHGFDLSERSVLTDTGMLRGERRQRRSVHRSIDPASPEYEAATGQAGMKQTPANQCRPRLSCSQSIRPASLPASNDFQVFVCRRWKRKRRKCHVEKRERDERLKLAKRRQHLKV